MNAFFASLIAFSFFTTGIVVAEEALQNELINETPAVSESDDTTNGEAPPVNGTTEEPSPIAGEPQNNTPATPVIQIPFSGLLSTDSKEFIKQLYDYVQNEGMTIGNWSLGGVSSSPSDDASLENLQLGTLLFLGSSENDIQMIILCLNDGQCLLISSQDDVTELTTSALEELNLSAYSYQALYTVSETVPPEQPTQLPVAIGDPAPVDGDFAQYYVNDASLPLVLSPNNTEMSLSDFNAWASSHQDELRALLTTNGALLLRGLPVQNAGDFASVVQSVIGQELIQYIGEGSRTLVVPGVYTSTEAPDDFKIPLHNELSCTLNPVSYISFFCNSAPTPGTGQTILARTADVTTALMNAPEVWDLFNGKIITYISRHPAKSCFYTTVNPTHKTWPEVFGTSDPDQVVAICEQKGYEFAWNGDWLEITRNVPAMQGPDAYFDETYWYNQAHLYHSNPRLFGGWLNYQLANLVYCIPSTRPYDVQFEDGTLIPQNVIYQVYDALDAQTVTFDWQQGDVLLIDNRRVLHGKAPSSGNRSIFAAMIQ